MNRGLNNFKMNLQLHAADDKYLKDNLTGFVPVEQAKEIMKDVARGSSILRLSKVGPMKSDTKKFPVMTDGPGAYWVGETERIKTSVATWIFPEMHAKKLAVIIPTTKEKLNDTTINVFGEMRPAIAEAFYTAIDAACLFGTNSPFAKNIFGVATDAGNVVAIGTNGEDKLDLDISDVMALIEDAGQDVNGFAAHYGMKNSLRKLRDGNGAPLFAQGTNQNEFYNNPIEFVRNGAWDKTKAETIAANWNYSLVGIRAGIEYEILTEATLQSVTMADGKPLSLAENDMIAIKATMRIGFLPIKDEAFAALTPKVEG
ncbi:phage major capsid protein [Tissierella sp.]|uniref:phage major capsid protein n=1 Tax=Tissierella sp. TaxID=41274 RepID=UPI0028ACF5E0|nr:phage major capsid protein [Tissierella sp.]